MRTLLRAVPGLVLVAALSLTATGCGGGDARDDEATPAGPPSTPAQLSPKEKLVEAAAKTNKGVVTVIVVALGMRTDARLDPDGRKATKNIVLMDVDAGRLRADLIQLDDDLYLRMPDLPGGKKWMRGDIADLPAGSPLLLLPEGDHTGAADLANCIVTATRKGGQEFAGTLDLTRSRTVSRAVISALGSKAGAVPFKVLASPSGDLFRFTLYPSAVLPALGEIEYSFSRMDGVEAERPPAAQVKELPRSIVDDFTV